MKQILMTRRPAGDPVESDFQMVEVERPTAGPGQLLLRNLWLSLDPYMRLGLDETPFPANNVAPSEPMLGGLVGEVIESNDPRYAIGDVVEARGLWEEYSAVNANHPMLRKLDPIPEPASLALGVVGLTGMTAYGGIISTAKVKAGETVVISAAGGAVGSTAGQIAKKLGARVVGIAGGAAKCQAVLDLGFDACVDYKAVDFKAQLKAAVPNGAEVYLENVGGDVTLAVLENLTYGARMPVSGFISYYGNIVHEGRDHLPDFYRMIMIKGLQVLGYNGVASAGYESLRQLNDWVKDGTIKPIETVFEGLEQAPAAFSALFQGGNTGKMIVRIA